MKKLSLVILIVALLACMLAVFVSAEEINGVHYSLDKNNKIATVSTGNRTATTEIAEIPSTFEYEGETYKVTAIANDAFYDNKTVKEIRILSEHITKIPSSMIANTYDGALEKIYIDFSNITSIGSAGLNPSDQTNGNGPKANKFYYYDAKSFIENGSDVKITDPDFSNVTSIGTAAFQGANFTKLTIPAAVEINNQIFRMSTIEELVIEGENRTKIDYYSFQACTKLEKITIKSKNLTTISNDVFAGDTAVKEIYIDLSKCESVSSCAFCFSSKYDGGNTTTQWYNLEGEKIVDLSSMKHFKNQSFASSNIGSAEIRWPNAVESFEDQCLRMCNINELIYINAASGVTLTVPFWAMNGNTFTTVILGSGVTSVDAQFGADCTIVSLADEISFTYMKNPPLTTTSTLYCKSANISHSTKPVIVPITSGTPVWSRTCGIYATVQTESGAVKVGTDTHNFEFVDYNNNYCPINVMGDYYCEKCKTTKQEIAVENYQGVAPKLGHDVSELEKILYANGIINVGDTTMGCADCDHTETTVGSANAIIEFKGFSAKIGGSEMLIGYNIDKEAFANYKLVNEDFKLGVAARILSEDGASDELVEVVEGTIQSTADKSIYAEITDTSIVSLVFKITGFSLESHYNLALAMSAFVYDDGEVDYICQNAEGVAGQYDVAYATTFNSEATE